MARQEGEAPEMGEALDGLLKVIEGFLDARLVALTQLLTLLREMAAFAHDEAAQMTADISDPDVIREAFAIGELWSALAEVVWARVEMELRKEIHL